MNTTKEQEACQRLSDYYSARQTEMMDLQNQLMNLKFTYPEVFAKCYGEIFSQSLEGTQTKLLHFRRAMGAIIEGAIPLPETEVFPDLFTLGRKKQMEHETQHPFPVKNRWESMDNNCPRDGSPCAGAGDGTKCCAETTR